MFEKQILDHGYLKHIESWGSDERIVEAARMSTDKGFLGWGGAPCPECGAAGRLSPTDGLFKTYEHSEEARTGCSTCKGSGKTIGDEKLLGYLWEHAHATPFEMAGITIEAQAPIFVFREWHRHRVPFGYNELSARYTPMPNLNYSPTPQRLFMGGGHLTKQAGTVAGAPALTDEAAFDWLNKLEGFYAVAEALYQHGLGVGIPKELARIVVPVGRYSRMRATGNLRGWLAFMKLRAATTAQYEIRVFAQAVGEILKQEFPRTWALYSRTA